MGIFSTKRCSGLDRGMPKMQGSAISIFPSRNGDKRLAKVLRDGLLLHHLRKLPRHRGVRAPMIRRAILAIVLAAGISQAITTFASNTLFT